VRFRHGVNKTISALDCMTQSSIASTSMRARRPFGFDNRSWADQDPSFHPNPVELLDHARHH
jgi:hypothetical protein